MSDKKQVLIRLARIIVVALAVVGFGCALSAVQVSAPQSKVLPAAGNAFVVTQICDRISSGDFTGAEKLLKNSSAGESDSISMLNGVIADYDTLTQKRRHFAQTEYEKQLAELEQYRKKWGQGDVNLPAVFAVILKAYEYSDQSQKKSLLEDSFTKTVVAKALEKAKEYEAKGKWLDAYVHTYYWLTKLYEDNKVYSDQAEKIQDKEFIKVSLQDDSCETVGERYGGVKKIMFVRAIKALDLNYVNIIDYSEMAKKAVERCELLGQVATEVNDFAFVESKMNRSQLANWSAGLKAAINETTGRTEGVTRDKFLALFEKVLSLNNDTLKLPEEVIVAQFAEASLSSLDPYTNLVWPRQVKDFEKTMTQEFTGIGIEISRAEGPLKVVSLIPDTPAYYSGLDAGDVIEAINGETAKDMSITCAVSKITGPADTKVTLTIRHEGAEKTEEITIKRAVIVVPTIKGWQRTEKGQWEYFVDKRYKIGYVRLTGFTETTSDDLEKTLKELEKQGLRGLILDLRFNSGGYLNSAADIVDKFVEDGVIVSTRPRFGLPNWQAAHKEGTHPNYPLVVLINEASASASEIVAGALHDETYNRAILVGTRSYGKGSVQTIATYPGGGAQLKYTMGYYYLPSGQKVESRYAMEKKNRKDWGIAPNINVELKGEELKKMFDVQRANDVLVKAGHKNGEKPLPKYGLAETVDSDPQLAVALMVVKSKIIEAQAKTLAAN